MQTISAATWCYALAAALIDQRLIRRPVVTEANGDSLVSIIIPARNEARNIAACLNCARKQLGVRTETIVADDSSDDDTAAIAESSGAAQRVIRCDPPPAGWVGKPWAAHCGALRSKGDWLLFADADMRMCPDAVNAALGLANDTHADALSLSATLEAGTLAEKIVLPAMAALIASAYPCFLINDPRSGVALMWGGFSLVRRDAYFLSGGHAALRAEIAEDRALAQRLKAFGFRVQLHDGSQLLRVRMYAGAADLWQGWRKNIYAGVRRKPALAAGFIVWACATLVLPLPCSIALSLAALRRRLSRRERLLAALSGLGVAGSFLVRTLRDRSTGSNPSSAAATPFAGAFIVGVMAASAWRTHSGQGQTWKGRIIGL